MVAQKVRMKERYLSYENKRFQTNVVHGLGPKPVYVHLPLTSLRVNMTAFGLLIRSYDCKPRARDSSIGFS